MGELRVPFTSGVVQFRAVPQEMQKVSILLTAVFAGALALGLDFSKFGWSPSPKVHDGGEPCFVLMVYFAKGATQGVGIDVRMRSIEVRSGGGDLGIPRPGGKVSHFLAEVLPGYAQHVNWCFIVLVDGEVR